MICSSPGEMLWSSSWSVSLVKVWKKERKELNHKSISAKIQFEEIILDTIWSGISPLHLHQREIETRITHTTSHRLSSWWHSNRISWWRSDQGMLKLLLLINHFFRHFGLRTSQWWLRSLVFFLWFFIRLLKPSSIRRPKSTYKSLQILSFNRFSCLPISRCGKFRGRWRSKECVFIYVLLT